MGEPIESLEYYDFKPAASERVNDWSTAFPIDAYSDHMVTQPGRSLLVLRGKLNVTRKSDGTVVTDLPANNIKLVFNGIMHVFDRIEYVLGNNSADSITKPGITLQ